MNRVMLGPMRGTEGPSSLEHSGVAWGGLMPHNGVVDFETPVVLGGEEQKLGWDTLALQSLRGEIEVLRYRG